MARNIRLYVFHLKKEGRFGYQFSSLYMVKADNHFTGVTSYWPNDAANP
jgi:hypothetical protein